jgi:hypothetical protein
MRRYEYKTVKIEAGWIGMGNSRAASEALVDVLNREGRSGWHVRVTPQPGMLPWRYVLLEREME